MDKEAAKAKPWMPSSVEKSYKQMYFKFIKAEHLPIMDTFGTIDAYVYLEWNGSKIKTKVVKMEDNLVEWNQEILIPLELPAANDSLCFNLYDYDATARDDLVASMKFSIKEILKIDSSMKEPGEMDYKMQWINLFGCNPDCTGSEADAQNNNPDLSTTFKGRVLVEYGVIDDQHPAMKIRDIDQNDEYKNRLEKMVIKKYEIYADLSSTLCLPGTENYKLKISIGELEWETGKPVQGQS